MNAYFSRTPDDFNYDDQRYPGQGDLHGLRVATRDALEKLTARIDALELEIEQMRTNHIHMDDEIGQIEDRVVDMEQNERRQERLSRHGKIAELYERADDIERDDSDLNKRLKLIELRVNTNREDIDYNHERIRDLEAVERVDHGKYAHLTEAQIDELVDVLMSYSTGDEWWSRAIFRIHARKALINAGLLEVE